MARPASVRVRSLCAPFPVRDVDSCRGAQRRPSNQATDAELSALAALLRDVLARLDRVVGDPPFT
jgi:hypothetical protein